VVESYALMLAALLLLGGSLSDRYGRRRIFVAGVALFAAASLGCALARDVPQLLAGRTLQGVGAALLVPGSMALIGTYFPEHERGRAFGIWTAFSGITSAAGPLVGGWLVDHFSWAWAFAVNLPVAALVIALTLVHVPRAAPTSSVRLDVAGAVTATLALAGAAFALTEGPARGWTAPAVLGAALLALAAGAAFARAERRHEAPMLPPAFLRNRVFVGTNLLTLLLYAALGGGLFFLPLNLVQVQGLSATAAAAALLPFVAVMFALSRWAGGLVEKRGARGPLVVGPAIAGAGFALLALPGVGTSYWTGFLPGVLVLGLGMTVTIAPLTATVMNAVDASQGGIASGVNNAVSRVAGLLAIAIFGGLMAAVFGPNLQAQLQQAGVAAGVSEAVMAQRDLLAALQPPASASAQDAAAIREAVKHAFVAGFRWIMGASAALAWTGAAVAAATVPKKMS
jgi:EmrB/QacA subfamily drug resistance transporter